MVVCKHCGTEIEDGLEYCPNCGQSIEEKFDSFFDADKDFEEGAYSIFDAPEDFDMDSLLSKEFDSGDAALNRSASGQSVPSFVEESEPLLSKAPADNQDNMADFMDLFGEAPLNGSENAQTEELQLEDLLVDDLSVESGTGGLELTEVDGTDFFALDDLFDNLDSSATQDALTDNLADNSLVELLASGISADAGSSENKSEEVKQEKKEKRSFFQKLFGNVEIDPSKIKPEPTPEEIAAKKQKEAEEKKAKADEKKLKAEEKKQLAQRNKEEKARLKALAKEEKKAKKLEEAKQILEEMKDTRINRVGATIVFVLFAVCAVGLFFGSGIFGYAVSVHSAESDFKKAYNNNVKYYTDAYNEIYGLNVKPEDQMLNDQIMTVMFVNKELTSYNSHMVLNDYESALHSLLLGLHRYGKFYEEARALGIDRDMDFVRTQILKELEETFHVSEDEAELLRSMLEAAGTGGINTGIDADAARLYNLKLYEIVEEMSAK